MSDQQRFWCDVCHTELKPEDYTETKRMDVTVATTRIWKNGKFAGWNTTTRTRIYIKYKCPNCGFEHIGSNSFPEDFYGWGND